MKKIYFGKLIAVLVYSLAANAAFALKLTVQPTDQSVSLGASVTELVSASSSAPPLSYQWRFNDAEITGATRRTLILTNIQLVNAGGYSIVVTDTTGSVTSRVARLDVDSTFTMITAGPVVQDSSTAVGAAWGDYDNDGFPDLLVGNLNGAINFLYRNKRDGTFERVLTTDSGDINSGIGAWGDYDNDGFPDLYTVSPGGVGSHLYHNQGNGTFLRVTNAALVGPIVSDTSLSSLGLAWGDYDNDGFLDMVVANGGTLYNLKNFLYHNEGNGTFAKITTGSIVGDLRSSWTVAWADYDDDGRLDLFVTNDNGEDNQLFHNDGLGLTEFTAAQIGAIAHEGGDSRGTAWGDYDNDGYLDLFVSHGPKNLLYHNNGNGTFTKITAGPIVNDTTPFKSHGCSWVDYDNDGYLDLFAVQPGDNNFLYHNNGDGTFEKITSGSLVNDGAGVVSIDAAWADYDNDGFMDVFIANDAKNSLFHNNGNTNHWINLKLLGTASNRGAIGAKVRVQTTIRGKKVWQRRDIGESGSLEGQSDLRASFGLGNATNIDTVRIEWPSGTIQELHDVGTKQFLTVTEPARLKGGLVGSEYRLVLNGGIGFAYDVQSSTNLIDWTSFTNLVTTNMTMPILSVDDVAHGQQKYFRAVRQ